MFSLWRSTNECLKEGELEIDVVITEHNKLSAVVLELKTSESSDGAYFKLDNPGDKRKSKMIDDYGTFKESI